jgi:hypothetical protein
MIKKCFYCGKDMELPENFSSDFEICCIECLTTEEGGKEDE